MLVVGSSLRIGGRLVTLSAGNGDGCSSLLCLVRCNWSTLRWVLACFVGTNVGLATGRYSGSSLPCLYRTPHALHSVARPFGPSLHCGVSDDPQCWHLFPLFAGHGAEGASLLDRLLFFFFEGFLGRCTDEGASGSQMGLSGGELMTGLSCRESVTEHSAGRHSGSNLPFLYLMPQAVQTSLRPIDPSIHKGGSDDPQCKQLVPGRGAGAGAASVLGGILSVADFLTR